MLQRITYPNTQPYGSQIYTKQWQVQPMSTGLAYKAGDLIKIPFSFKQGFLDPHQSYLRIRVSIPATNDFLLQIDGSAQSFISSLIIQQASQQIERIDDYDNIAQVLLDIGLTNDQCADKQVQGLGFMDLPGITQPISPLPLSISAGTVGTQVSSTTKVTPPCTLGMMQDLISASYPTGPTMLQRTIMAPAANLLTPPYNSPTSTTVTFPTAPGTYRALRSDMTLAMAQSPYLVQGPSSIKSSWSQSPQGISFPTLNTSPYYNVFLNSSNPPPQPLYLPSTCQWQGYDRLINPYLSRGCWQPILTNKIPAGNFIGGMPNKYQAMTTRIFHIPLISGVLGTLVPQQKLIPLAFLPDILIQIRLSKYAMFSSGYNDVVPTIAGTAAISRDYIINSISYVMNISYFNQDITARILSQPSITLLSETYQQGPSYQVANPAMIMNSWPVNNGVTSLKTLFFFFFTATYQTYPFARKQFRSSRALSRMQIKLGSKFWPPQPIQGNASNPADFDLTGSNAPFFQQIQSLTNRKHNILAQAGRINNINFAVNVRPYDPTRTGPYITPAAFPPPFTSSVASITSLGLRGWTQAPPDDTSNILNTHTAMGRPFFWENSYRGTSVFCFNFAKTSGQYGFWGGVNTNELRPFEVILDVQKNTTMNYTGIPACQLSTQLKFFLLCDFKVTYTPRRVITMI